jgi:hypothetical protein
VGVTSILRRQSDLTSDLSTGDASRTGNTDVNGQQLLMARSAYKHLFMRVVTFPYGYRQICKPVDAVIPPYLTPPEPSYGTSIHTEIRCIYPLPILPPSTFIHTCTSI